MAIWLDRGRQGPRTHALVIGCSRYRHLPGDLGESDPPNRTLFGLAQLESGAASALAVARWLEKSYRNPGAALGTVRLHMSPSELELREVAGMAEAAAHAGPATKSAVEKALTAWFRDCSRDDGNIAILYVAGHGIELNKDDGGIVLLEDFAGEKPAILRNALDTGNIRRAMAGKVMARTQLYFVDACRIRPDEVLGVKLRTGIEMDEPGSDPPSASPIFFSASSGTLSLGRRGQGTLFSQALIECMDMRALTKTDDGAGWRVTDSMLVDKLADRVQELAAGVGHEQETTTAGMFRGRTIHQPAQPPKVPLRIDVNPSSARGRAFASVGPTTANMIVVDHPLEPPQVLEVPAGVYLAKVDVRPPPGPALTGTRAFDASPPAPSPVTVEVR